MHFTKTKSLPHYLNPSFNSFLQAYKTLIKAQNLILITQSPNSQLSNLKNSNLNSRNFNHCHSHSKPSTDSSWRLTKPWLKLNQPRSSLTAHYRSQLLRSPFPTSTDNNSNSQILHLWSINWTRQRDDQGMIKLIMMDLYWGWWNHKGKGKVRVFWREGKKKKKRNVWENSLEASLLYTVKGNKIMKSPFYPYV